MVTLKRVYEQAGKEDGFRVLVDRLWPRGVSKANAHIDLWLKEIAPSDTLRKWFKHDPNKWTEFVKKYKNELKDKKDLVAMLKSLESKHKQITLIYGAKDTEHNQAVVLRQVLS